MIDLKTVLTYVLQQGLIDFGYGVQSITSADASSTLNPNTLTVKRSGAQDEDNRPLITLRRIVGPTSNRFFVGNVGIEEGSSSTTVPLMLVQDTIRISVETTQDAGGQSLVDKLMIQIPAMLLQNWDAMTFPEEVGGYGLMNVTFRGSGDGIRPFTEAGGKVIYTNAIDFSATLTLDVATQDVSLGTIEVIEFDPQLANTVV